MAGEVGLHIDVDTGCRARRGATRERQRPAQLHGGGSRVEQRRLQRVQGRGQVPTVGWPAACTAHPPGAGL